MSGRERLAALTTYAIAYLVMPIGYALKDLKFARLPALKNHWRLSMNAIVMAAKVNGVVSESKVTSLYVQLSRHGCRRHEPYRSLRRSPQ
jgi:hypothetical protein